MEKVLQLYWRYFWIGALCDEQKLSEFKDLKVLVIREMFYFGNYMFEVNIRNTRTRCEICLKLTRTTPERRLY